MQEHHYLGALPKIGESLWYVASWCDQWVALLSFSAAALKCTARDQWIGWDVRHQFDRLKLVTNNSRFLILPDWHFPNLASRILSLCQKRLVADWQSAFGHLVVLLETFVDPRQFRGTIYKAANWLYVGDTKGFRRTRKGYSATAGAPKMVFVKPLRSDAQALLSRPILEPAYRTGGRKIMLSAQQMQSLPEFCRYPRPAPRPRPTPSTGHRFSHRRRRHPVRIPATRPSRIGPTASAQRHGSASAAAAKKPATSSPASPSSAMCSSASTPSTWTVPCSAGTTAMLKKTKAWPLTERRCATPSMSTVIKPIS